MNTCTKQQAVQSWLLRHPKIKQWLWFVLLWVGGVATVVALTIPIKVLIHFMK
jgi:hypothetical protein